jgi:hypothetical protein
MDHMERHSGTMRGLGTLLNVAAILAGASAGTLLGDRLPQRLRDTLVAALGCSPWPWASNRPRPPSATTWPVPRAGRRPCSCWEPCWPAGWPARPSSWRKGLAVVAAMTAVGGLLVVAIGLRLLGLARIRVANLLPAVLLAPWPPAWSQPSDSVKNEGGRQWAT